MDLKVMPKSQKGHKYVLCVIDEVTNFLIMVPIFQARSGEVGEALLEHVITKHCIKWMFLILFDMMKVWRFSQKQNLNFVERQAFVKACLSTKFKFCF